MLVCMNSSRALSRSDESGPVTVLHGSGRGRIEAVHLSGLCDANGFRASKL